MPGQIKKWLAGSALALLLTATCLFIHVWWATRPSDDHHAQLQLGRIDFPAPLSHTQMAEAKQALLQIGSIGISKFNRDTTSLIFSIPTGAISLQEIGRRFGQQVSFPSQPYIPEVTNSSGGCPVTGKKSLLYRFSTYVHNTFS